LNFAFFKRYNGYQPFLYNISVDVCKVIKYPKSNPVFTFAHSLFRDSSNINHTCPYNNDLIVDKVSAEFVNTQFTKTLPFPLGDYLFQTIWLADNIRRAEVKVYGTLS
uniref:Uncharacterized protein LOC108053442 n=1 Tax=Drosophila rhopaloa TaxID=1041015 RepID=A0A6P4FPY6_DRORH